MSEPIPQIGGALSGLVRLCAAGRANGSVHLHQRHHPSETKIGRLAWPISFIHAVAWLTNQSAPG